MASLAATLPARRLRNPSALPGFGLSLGFTLFYLTAIVLIPLTALVIRLIRKTRGACRTRS